MPASCRRGPGNVAKLIALAIIPQTVKFTSDAPLAPPPLFQIYLTAANQIERLLPGLLEIGKHANRLLSLGHRPAFGQAQRRLITKESSAQTRIAAFRGHHRIARFSGIARLHAQVQIGRRTAQSCWCLIDDACANRNFPAISNFHNDAAGNAKARSFLPNAPHFQLLLPRESQQIP